MKEDSIFCCNVQDYYSQYEHDITLAGEFIRKVRNLDISDDEKAQIIARGLQALLGKERL